MDISFTKLYAYFNSNYVILLIYLSLLQVHHMKYSVRTFFALFAVLASTAAFSAINVINKSCENGAISYTECPTDAMGKPAGSCSTVGNNVSRDLVFMCKMPTVFR